MMRLIARAVALVAGVFVAVLVAGGQLTNHTSAATAASRAGSPAAGAINLRTAGNFSVLAGTTVTSIPPTSMSAELGLSPGSSVTGAPSASAKHIDDATAVTAKTDLTAAYKQVAAAPTTTVIPDAGDIGGETLTPGVYASASSIFLTGTVTLNAKGNPNALFIFKAGSTLITASNAKVAFINGAQACNVYWQVGSSATLGTGTRFAGTILALTSITSTTGVTVNGRLLAQNAAVTLDSTTIKTSGCSGATGTTTSTTPTKSTPTTTTTTTAPGTGPCGCTNPTTTTITITKTTPCSCTLPGLPAKTIKKVVASPGATVTVKLPAPGCGCVVAPGTPPPPAVKYVVVWVPAHCHVTVNQKTGRLKFKAAKGHRGKFSVRLKHGKQKIDCNFLVK
jgi:hypothetical protein